ncbi:MAG: 3-methyl-2-oxobutanoate hydroxymethyltransferase [Phycisphaerae bacterium]|nr:3-methyl-2-oxobutanoate hydroxymethyltransferase [Phycisphaerae bacterium]
MTGATTKTTIASLLARKRERRKVPVLTCYDCSTARLMAEAGVDVILVGDTYGEVCLGHASTLPVTMDQMITIAAAVRRGAPAAFLIGDMPYLSYQTGHAEAIRNAGRFMADAGCDCVKIEVDGESADLVAAMSRATIPVMAHLGLKPQAIHRYGGYRVQGRTAEEACKIIHDARVLEQAGAVALLLEAVPGEVARVVAERTSLPVIGCVAGPYCDGTVVVIHDMLGYSAGHPPRSVKRYADLHTVLTQAFSAYAEDVMAQRFPGDGHWIAMSETESGRLTELLSGEIKPGTHPDTEKPG